MMLKMLNGSIHLSSERVLKEEWFFDKWFFKKTKTLDTHTYTHTHTHTNTHLHVANEFVSSNALEGSVGRSILPTS
jgi:hypothetical protein